MIQVLLVDDDRNLLADLADMLGYLELEWQIYLAPSGEDALDLLESKPVDVVVADMNMPGMDGAELLAIVSEKHPHIMRILMSGNGNTAFTARLVPHAHQFIQKPCQPSLVQATIQRTYELGQRLSDPDLKATLGQITELPRPPQSIVRLNSLLERPDADINEVAAVVEEDMALTAKLFQLVNSASYGLSRNIEDVREVVSYLGLSTVRNLAASIEVFRSLSAASSAHHEAIAHLHEHATAVAGLARQLVLVREQANEAFVAGLLHDVGLLAVVSYLPDRFDELQHARARSNMLMSDLEIDILGATHPDIGAYLLNLWGLPFGVVEAVARHHDAKNISHRRMDPTHAVCIADAIVSSQTEGALIDESSTDPLEWTYLEELGLLERVAGLMSGGANALNFHANTIG